MIVFSEIIQKIDYAVVFRISIEIILFIGFLKVVKKILEVIFSKLTAQIDDTETKRQYSTIRFLFASVINTVISLFFLTNLLGAFGVDMKPILATAGVFGVAIGFGAKRFVEDIISGLIILFTGQIRVGDYVTVGGSTGTVEKVDLAMIKLRSYNGDVHFVRNGLVDKVVNHTREFSTPYVDVPVSYESDITYVISVLRDLCGEIQKNPDFQDSILAQPEIVAIDSFGASSINLRVRFKTTASEQWNVQRYFRRMIKQRFDELKISIPFNQLDVHILQS